jgi:hypothetical protein
VLAGKIVARFAKGLVGQRAVADPPGIRTVAQFATPASIPILLQTIAAELRHELEPAIEVIDDAVRLKPPDGPVVDIVRLTTRSPSTCTLELTRAFTGIALDDNARAVLAKVHVALTAYTCDVVWYARQDRAFVAGDPFPYDPVQDTEQPHA